MSYPSNTIHVYPRNDEREHYTDLEECWCDPDVQYIDPDTGLPWSNGAVIVVHNSADQRELIEQAEAIKAQVSR